MKKAQDKKLNFLNHKRFGLEYQQNTYFLYNNLQSNIYQQYIQQEYENLLLDNQKQVLEHDPFYLLEKQQTSFNQIQNNQISLDYKNQILNSLFINKQKINHANSVFFKVSGVDIYNDEILILNNFKNQQSQWYSIQNQQQLINRQINIPNDLIEILNNKQLFEHTLNTGRFIIYGHKWGFLLSLSNCDSFYKGELNQCWNSLLQTKFFQRIINQYSQYILENQQEKQQILRNIPDSYDDKEIEQNLVDFYDLLFQHQKKEVGWMLSLEINPFIGFNNDLDYIPLLDTGYYFHPNNPLKLVQKQQLKQKQYYLPGAVLASQIGTGKTISIISLCGIGYQLRNNLQKFQNENQNLTALFDGVFLPSLIIVTKNILYQWFEEFKKFAPFLRVKLVENWQEFSHLNTLIQKGILTQKEYLVFSQYDIIITHRNAIVEAQLNQKNLPQLFNVHFSRVIYDEMHEISSSLINFISQKDIQQQQQKKKSQKNDIQDAYFNENIVSFFKAVIKIKRRFSWGITGTPDNLNYVDDSFPMVYLLNLCEEYYNVNQYNQIKDNFIKNNMRKNQLQDFELPSVDKKIIKVLFKQIQKILYRGKQLYSNQQGEQYARQILSYFSKQYEFLENIEEQAYPKAIQIVKEIQESKIQLIEQQLSTEKDKYKQNQLIQLKQILISEDNFYCDIIKLINQEVFSCNLCFEDLPKQELVVTNCLHSFCHQCYKNLFQKLVNIKCPYCNQEIEQNNVIIHPDMIQKNQSKLDKLLQYVNNIPQDEKVIIFTQFHELTLKISEKLQIIDAPHVLLFGEPSEINIRLQKFKTIPEIRILIMSVEQAASGINLTEANHVIFMHPIFGLTAEKAKNTYAQCIGRALRIGQQKQVFAQLLSTEDSLERNYEIQFKNQ